MDANLRVSDHIPATLTYVGKGASCYCFHKKFNGARTNWGTYTETLKLHTCVLKRQHTSSLRISSMPLRSPSHRPPSVTHATQEGPGGTRIVGTRERHIVRPGVSCVDAPRQKFYF